MTKFHGDDSKTMAENSIDARFLARYNRIFSSATKVFVIPHFSSLGFNDDGKKHFEKKCFSCIFRQCVVAVYFIVCFSGDLI
jgi:hypothetical protein